MRVKVRAPKGLRVPLPGKQYVTDGQRKDDVPFVEMERTAFVHQLIASGDLIDVDAEAEAEADRKKSAPAKADAAVKEG